MTARALGAALALTVLASIGTAAAAEKHGGHKAAITPAEKANAAAMETMMNAMMVKPTGDPDKDFAVMMLPHHQGAIDMAKVELEYGKDPTMRALAKDIVAAQEKEIAEMKAWLAAK